MSVFIATVAIIALSDRLIPVTTVPWRAAIGAASASCDRTRTETGGSRRFLRGALRGPIFSNYSSGIGQAPSSRTDATVSASIHRMSSSSWSSRKHVPTADSLSNFPTAKTRPEPHVR